MRTAGEHRQRTVAAVIGEGVLTFDFACACEVFGYDRSDIVSPWYRFLVVSQDPPPIRTSTGFMMMPDHGLDALDEADTVVVPGRADDLRPPKPGVAADRQLAMPLSGALALSALARSPRPSLDRRRVGVRIELCAASRRRGDYRSALASFCCWQVAAAVERVRRRLPQDQVIPRAPAHPRQPR